MNRFSVVGFKFNTDSPYMSSGEACEFKRLLDGGRLSFYRYGICAVCSAKVIEGKTYCSKACFEHHEKEREIMEELEGLIDHKIELETVDAIRRKGTLTRINWGHVEVNEKKVHFPKEVELNGDSAEMIPWLSLKWIREVG